jgi:hypothetical protein
MNSSLLKRIITSEYVIKKNNLELDINLDIINEINKLTTLERNKYTIEKKIINISNYDDKILKMHGIRMKDILNKNKNITTLIDTSFYGNNLLSSFISTRIIRDIINKSNIKTILKCKNREIVIFSKKNIDDNFIKKIDSIFNFFDMITKKSNYYKLELFLSNKKKYINKNLNSLDPDNINSGATLPGHFIYIFRKEELVKVLFHELVHYLDLDMRDYQDKFKFLYSKINLKAPFINPNEAYTEIIALLLMNIWEFKYKEIDIDINLYVSKKLTLELGWSYYQICKILNYFACYKTYEELFSDNCEFRQNSNVLSYFILKTYFLQFLNLVLKDFTLDNLFFNKSKAEFIYKNTDLLDHNFSKNINTILSRYNDDSKNFDIYSMRMSCTG